MKKKLMFAVIGVICIIIVVYLGFDRLAVKYNNRILKSSITSIEKKRVSINEVVPFDWDAVYSFEPYTSKKDIEAKIGFKSSFVYETVSEGMVQLIFIKNKKIVSNTYGYPSFLEYDIKFKGVIKFNEGRKFNVIKNKGVVTLKEY